MLRTDKQREAICTDCPLSKTIDLVGDTQTLLLIKRLFVEPQRFGELVESLPGISTRTVTNKLKGAITEGLIEKDAQDRYALTKKGQGLKSVLNAMRSYGEKHLS